MIIKAKDILKVKRLQSAEGRIFFADNILSKIGLKPGTFYKYLLDQNTRSVEITQDEGGSKIISKRKVGDSEIPLIDIRNQKISELLSNCDYLHVMIYGDKIVVKGHISTGTNIRESLENVTAITSLTFCAGGGVSAMVAKDCGIEDSYLLEYNPLDGPGQWDRYSKIAEKNHPDSVIFNIPIEEFSIDMLPAKRISIWMVTLPCNEFSIVNQNEREENQETMHSMHHFLHLVRIFTETPKHLRPECLFFENVAGFEKVAGKSLEYFLKDQGYFVTSAVLDGADYGSRMHRKRWYMIANVHSPYEFPEATGKVASPFTSLTWFDMNEFDWKNPENSPSIKRLVEREKKMGSATINIKSINPAVEGISLTIPKQYRISVPQGMVKHPDREDTFAIWPTKYLKKLFGVPDDFYLGESETVARETLGQSVDCNFLKLILSSLKEFILQFHKRTRKNNMPLGQQALFA